MGQLFAWLADEEIAGFGPDLDLGSPDGASGFKLSGAEAGDFSGRPVALAGDVNGDGFADLTIGVRGAGSFSGASYVVFGMKPNTRSPKRTPSPTRRWPAAT